MDRHEALHHSGECFQGIPQHPAYLNGVWFNAYTVWHKDLTAGSDRQYLEETVMPVWSRLWLKHGDIVMATTNLRGGRLNVVTGMVGVVTEFKVELAADVEKSCICMTVGMAGDVRQVLLDGMREACGVKDAGGRFTGQYVFPVVRFWAPGGSDSGFEKTVQPRFRAAFAVDGTRLVARVQLPLCSGVAMKFGQSLGCTFDSVPFLFADLIHTKKEPTQPYMAVTRQRHPSGLRLPFGMPVSSGMFAPPAAALAWFKELGWEEMVVVTEEKQRKQQHAGVDLARRFVQRWRENGEKDAAHGSGAGVPQLWQVSVLE
jgi:hypothetical protein